MQKRDLLLARQQYDTMIAEAESGNLASLKRLSDIVSVRRLPDGRLVAVPAGLGPGMREISADTVISLRSLLDIKRRAKRARYLKLKNDPSYKGPRIVAEGDSWFEYPCTTDLVEWLGQKYAVLSLAKAGDAWGDVLADEGGRYPDGTPTGVLETAASEQADIVLLSVGGNDVVGDCDRYTYDFDPQRPRDQYVRPNFKPLLDYVVAQYIDLTGKLTRNGAKVILHSYDYPDPRPGNEGGQWIGGPLENNRGIDDRTLWRQIVNTMLDRFCTMMKDRVVRPSAGMVRFVDNRGTIGTDDYNHGPKRAMWNDELHGSSAGFKKLAAKIEDHIRAGFAQDTA